MKTQLITLMVVPALNLLVANPPEPALPPVHRFTNDAPDQFNSNQFARPLTNQLGTNDRGFADRFATNTPGTIPPRDRIFPPTSFPPDRFPPTVFPADRFPPDKFPPDRIPPDHLKHRPAPPKNVTIIPSTPGATPLVVKVKNRGR